MRRVYYHVKYDSSTFSYFYFYFSVFVIFLPNHNNLIKSEEQLREPIAYMIFLSVVTWFGPWK